MAQPGPHQSLWDGCAVPGSDGVFLSRGTHQARGCLAFTESRNSDNGVSSPWKRWLASAWSVAHVEFPGLWAFLPQSAEFSSLCHLGQTDRRPCPAPALLFTKLLPAQDLIMASPVQAGQELKCALSLDTEAPSGEVTCPSPYNWSGQAWTLHGGWSEPMMSVCLRTRLGRWMHATWLP